MFTPTHTNSTTSKPGKPLREVIAALQTNPEYRRYVDVTEPLLIKAQTYLAEKYMDRVNMIGLGCNDNASRYSNCVTVGADEETLALIPDSVEVTDDAGDKHQMPVNKIVTGKFYANKGLADEEAVDKKPALLNPGS